MDAALLAEAIWFNLIIIVSLQTSKFSKFVTRVIVLQRKCVFHFFHADPTITADCSSDTTLELSKNKINSPVGTGGRGKSPPPDVGRSVDHIPKRVADYDHHIDTTLQCKQGRTGEIL